MPAARRRKLPERKRSGVPRRDALNSRGNNLENNMTIQRFETGPRMSQVVVHGDTVYLAGIVAHATAGESVTKQTQEILSIIDGHLAKAGSNKSKLLSATIYITDMKNFAEMNAVWDGWVSPGNTPARATVEVNLAGPKYGVASYFPFSPCGRRRLREAMADEGSPQDERPVPSPVAELRSAPPSPARGREATATVLSRITPPSPRSSPPRSAAPAPSGNR
jgi:enamine deaminase RidA (YjgF/YER057c/UK114 family)